MTRPIHVNIDNGVEGWDSDVNDDFDLVFDTPLPPAEFTTEAGLPDATQYDRCIAAVNNTDSGWTIYMSDGTNWVPLGKQAVAQVDSIATTVINLRTDFNALLQNLRDAGVIDT